MNRSILADILDNEYEIIEAEDGAVAIAILTKHVLDISLVLLGVVMPKVDGFEVLRVMNQKHWIEDIPVIMISEERGSSQMERAYELGVTDFITRPFDTLIVHRRVVNTLLLYGKQKRFISMLADQIYEKERRDSMMVDILSHIVEFRNGEGGLHILRVRKLTEIFLREIQKKSDQYKISPDEISIICTASALHDIGKIAVDEKILNKPGKLTSEEFEIMKTHSVIGADMMKNLPLYKNEPLVKTAYEICRWHHERYDGRGYPDGLVGDEIPISAQIVALADVYDTLTSERCYKKAYSHETSIQMILDGQCGAFNPLLMKCLIDMASTLKEELANASDTPYHPEIQRVFGEMFDQKNMIVSNRSLRLLDHERMKYKFLAEMTEEIQFEYTLDPPLLTLSGWGAKKMGLDEVIMEPRQNSAVTELLGEGTWDKLSGMLRATSPNRPIIAYECLFNFGDVSRWHKIIARAMWSPDEPPRYTGAIGKCVDIHDSRTRMEELERRASHDTLTGLLNHASAKKLIEDRIEQNPCGVYILAIFDLDYFKTANDSYGHMFGDRVLKHTAEKLRQNTRRGDIVARVGGDEFLIFIEYKTNAEQVINRIFNAIIGQLEEFPLSLSMGVASTKGEGYDYDRLFMAADQALYTVKRAGGGQYRFYDDSMSGTFSAISPIEQEKEGENS